MLDERSADDEFFLNIHLPVKFATYFSLALFGMYGSDLLFNLLGLN